MMTETPEIIDLAFIARQTDRILREMAGLRDDMNVPTSIVLRQERNSNAPLPELRAINADLEQSNTQAEKRRDRS